MRWLVLVTTLFGLASVNAESTPLLASIEVELSQRQSLPLANTISFEFTSQSAQSVAKSLQAWSNTNTQYIDEQTLLVEMSELPTFTGQVSQQFLQNSFVIDIDEHSTQQFTSGFTEESDSQWQLEQLVAYVSGYIDNPSYIHGFNIASVIATQRSGDCTEFAVLTTTLARSLGLPARIVLGTVIIEHENGISAYGHAWAEVWRAEKWHILDAALFGSKAVKQFYLPAAALTNEGPGYTLSLARATQLMPIKIDKLRSAGSVQ